MILLFDNFIEGNKWKWMEIIVTRCYNRHGITWRMIKFNGISNTCSHIDIEYHAYK